MKTLKRGMIVDINLNPVKGAETGKIRPGIIVTNNVYNEITPVIQVVPITSWNEKKALIKTNVQLDPSTENGLSKRSIADCLQTRPIDYQQRLIKIRGTISEEKLIEINLALKMVFGID
jgi:mRNA interferase MazF